MAWQVTMDEDGAITLPPDLIAEMGWTTETRLCWIENADSVALTPIDDPDGSNGSCSG